MPDKDEPRICPNCGFPATRNYCAECGQQTHLHKETFWSLIVHFVGHYFHYDSKFWQTMKTLWFSPGKLTQAYWNKQRARYIAPISLYIFISFVYFLINFSVKDHNPVKQVHTGRKNVGTTNKVIFPADDNAEFTFYTDSVADAIQSDSTAKKTLGKGSTDSVGFVGFVNKKIKKIDQKHGNVGDFISEKVEHDMPKLFFFMIPVLALLLKLFYMRRKDIYFVDHAIFAIHYQAFWFSLFIIAFINIGSYANKFLKLALIITAFVYMVKALRNVYGSGRSKAVFYTISLAMAYSFFLGILFLLYFIFIFLMV